MKKYTNYQKCKPRMSFPEWNFAAISHQVKNHGGITIHPITQHQPVNGYVISTVSNVTIPANEFFEHQHNVVLAQFIIVHKEWFNNLSHYLGVWHDKEEGTVSISKVTIVDNKTQALTLGSLRNQKAIWDLNAEKEIGM